MAERKWSHHLIVFVMFVFICWHERRELDSAADNSVSIASIWFEKCVIQKVSFSERGMMETCSEMYFLITTKKERKDIKDEVNNSGGKKTEIVSDL